MYFSLAFLTSVSVLFTFEPHVEERMTAVYFWIESLSLGYAGHHSSEISFRWLFLVLDLKWHFSQSHQTHF